ncbi:MAG: M10 family metallopeptidase [Xanthobacteraceae bacterium]
MATPTQNSIGVTTFDPNGYGIYTSLLHGTKWGGALGTGVQLNWSFPTYGTSSFLSNYSALQEYLGGFRAFTPSEQGITTTALAAVTTLCGLSAYFTSDGATVGELRFAGTDRGSPGEAAHAYLPANDPSSGDVWMLNSQWHTNHDSGFPRGGYDYIALVHEIMHAVGVKHPFEGPVPIDNVYDSYRYSIMSYESKAGTNSNYASFYPTTPMYLDIAALQILYGKDTQTNKGNNTYTYSQGTKYWETIYDAGGTDTIVYRGTSSSVIDLRIGFFSTVSDPIALSDNTTARDLVCIGPSTNIERATGGNGNDKLIGNSLANILTGNSGNDGLYGNSGNDVLSGGAGRDSLSGGAGTDRLVGSTGSDRLTGGSGKDFFDFKGALNSSNVDTVFDFIARDDTIRVDNAYFTKLSNGALSSSAFWIGSRAHDSNDRIIYNKSNGDLIYDTNGSSAGGAIVFAHLDRGLSLTKADFIVI